MDFDDERQCLHVLYSSFGDLDELVALSSGYKQLGITLAFSATELSFLIITFSKNITLSCIVSSRRGLLVFGDETERYACIRQFSLIEIAAIDVTFTFVLA